jgi:spore germination protein
MSHRVPPPPRRFRRRLIGGRQFSLWKWNWRIPLLGCLLLGVTIGLQPPLSTSRGRVIAYVAYWDQRPGFASAERHLDTLSAVSPWWYSVDYTGEVVPQHAGVTDIDANTVSRLSSRGIRIMPTISNHRNGEWDNHVVEQVLAEPGSTAKHIRNIVDLVVRAAYVGIDIDYENLPAASRVQFSRFLRDLSAALHSDRKLLSVSVHPKTSDQGSDERNVAQDYRAIGAAADEFRIMTYDYHWATSRPGPVAPIGWVDQVIAYTLRHVPREKVILGIPLFGYDWVNDGAADPVTWNQVQALVRAHQVAVTYDKASKASWFAYMDDDGRQHTVWFDDTEGMAAKLRLARSYGIAGVFLWRLGGESPEVWRLLRANRP